MGGFCTHSGGLVLAAATHCKGASHETSSFDLDLAGSSSVHGDRPCASPERRRLRPVLVHGGRRRDREQRRRQLHAHRHRGPARRWRHAQRRQLRAGGRLLGGDGRRIRLTHRSRSGPDRLGPLGPCGAPDGRGGGQDSTQPQKCPPRGSQVCRRQRITCACS